MDTVAGLDNVDGLGAAAGLGASAEDFAASRRPNGDSKPGTSNLENFQNPGDRTPRDFHAPGAAPRYLLLIGGIFV